MTNRIGLRESIVLTKVWVPRRHYPRPLRRAVRSRPAVAEAGRQPINEHLRVAFVRCELAATHSPRGGAVCVVGLQPDRR